MQTILGAGGAIGKKLAKELLSYTKEIRLVSRNPKKINPDDELFATDLSKRENVFKAVEGSDIVYLTIGFEYRAKVWRKKWPPMMRNAIDACKKYSARLVFFDNIYMYDPDHLSHMTEKTPMRPVSKKGAIRAEIAGMLLDEIKRGKIEALIARAADFIADKNSVLIELGLENLKKGKAATWFVDANRIHNFTFSTDAAKATAILGNTPTAYNQVWHLPSYGKPLTGKDWVNLMAKVVNKEPRIKVMSKGMISMAGIFIPVVRELKEMLYQYEHDYFFDSSNFEREFSFKPTPPEKSLREVSKDIGI